MKTLKFTMVLAVLLCIGSFAEAQDYSEYLESAKRLLKEGNCDKAKSNYDVYVKLTGQTVSWLDSDIKDCIAKKTKPKTYNIGDDAKDFVGYSGYKLAYLDGSGKHGFAIKFEDYSKGGPYSCPSLDELKLMYKNRHSLGLNGEYWSSTEVDGSGSFFTMEKYYTYDFSIGEIKERRLQGSGQYKRLEIERF